MRGDLDFSLPMAAAGLMPHRPPMRLVDSLLECSAAEQVAAATVVEGCPLVAADGGLEEVGLVELIAQAFAAAKGYEDLRLGRPVQMGFLVAIKSFHATGRAMAGDCLLVRLRPLAAIDSFAVVTGEIFRGCDSLAAASIKLWLESSAGK